MIKYNEPPQDEYEQLEYEQLNDYWDMFIRITIVNWGMS